MHMAVQVFNSLGVERLLLGLGLEQRLSRGGELDEVLRVGGEHDKRVSDPAALFTTIFRDDG